MMFGYGATTIKGDRPTGRPVEGALQSNAIRAAKRQRQTQRHLGSEYKFSELAQQAFEISRDTYWKDYCLKLRSLSSVNVWAFGQQPALEAFSPSCFMVNIYLYTIICTFTIRRNNYCVTADTKFNTNVLAFPD
jgi:hypothetical protein